MPDVTFAPQLMRKHGRYIRQHACGAGRRTAASGLLLTPEEQPPSVVGVRCVLYRRTGTGGGMPAWGLCSEAHCTEQIKIFVKGYDMAVSVSVSCLL